MNALAKTRPQTTDSVSARPLVRIVVVGSVDHGKSTLIGRLLHETGSLPEGKLEHLKAISDRRGMPFEWSFLLDALQTERDHGITVDTSQIRFRTKTKDFVLIDAPGHVEFLRNIITGAAQADAAILIVDATEGVREQTRRHVYLLHLLGITQVAVVINKMDRIAYDAGRFRIIETEITDYLQSVGLSPTAVIPVSARDGVGITEHTYTSEWYRPTVLQTLDRFESARPAIERELRLPVQAVYKFDERRILAGRVESGYLAAGDEVVAVPSGQRALVKSIEVWPAEVGQTQSRQAFAGQSVGITLDRELFVARGDVLSAPGAPSQAGKRVCARVFWLHRQPLEIGSRVIARVGTAQAQGVVISIGDAIDPGSLTAISGRSIGQNHVGEISIDLSQQLAADPYTVNPANGRIVLEFEGRIAGGGLILALNQDRSPASGRARPAAAAVTNNSLQDEAARLTELLAELTPDERIARLRSELSGRIAFTTSFGLEDQVILHMLAERNLDIDVVTLDTGRLFNETYDLWAESELRYGRGIRMVSPQPESLEALIKKQGINGFYHAVEAREACCHVRKVEPLNRALAGAKVWVTGLRADQSDTRRQTKLVEVDAVRDLLKVNPLFDWTGENTLSFASAQSVPINPLHAKGFVSIGCAPCTRAIKPGEPERAGRWWWEHEEHKECGLHNLNRNSKYSR